MDSPWLAKFKKDFQNKKVLILGLGVLGRGVADAQFFAQIGAKVTVTDLKTAQELKPSLKKLKNLPVKFILGQHRKKDILSADLILRNASVPRNSSFLKLARKNKIPIAMDEALFAQYAPVKIIGITGTRGKSTTTTLIYQILKKAGLPVWLAGNIRGKATLPLLKKVKQDDWVVMELSSWQLQGFDQAKISPHLSVITNIYQDHLNRYKKMADYIKDKKVIFKYQTKKDFLVLNQDSKIVSQFGGLAKSQAVFFSPKDFPLDWQLKIKGDHNQLNVAAALKVADILKINRQVVKKTVASFSGLPHRLEKVAVFKGVEYINDSTSTTPAAGLAALASFKKPLVLIAGGNSKNLDMSAFAKKIVQKVKKVVFLKGNETDNLIKLIKKFGGQDLIDDQFVDLKKAIFRAQKLAVPGEVILLSPGCTSFGTFINEFDRGDQFKKIVKSL